MKAMIVGAGALGLGFLAERMADEYEICLADTSAKREELGRIEDEQGFAVNICGPDAVRVGQVSGRFTTVLTDSPADRGRFTELAREADLVLTCTARKILDGLVDLLAPAMASGKKQWLLFCENGIGIAAQFAARFGPDTTLVDTVMSRMCRFAGPEESGYVPMWPGFGTSLVVEDYSLLPVDGELCSGGPFSAAFTMVSPAEFQCWEDVKLYMHNGMHAFVSYHACLDGAARLCESSLVLRELAGNVMLDEVVPAILRTNACANRQEVEHYASDLLARFFNPYFGDSVARGIRGVREKLAPGERLLGGCDYIRRAGIEPVGYSRVIDRASEILAQGEGLSRCRP